MRWIKKKREPRKLVEWRSRYRGDINFGYSLLRGSHDVIEVINRSLLNEQGHLCAYTGRRIRVGNFHIEHLNAQEHCQNGEDIAYDNIVACYPEPNHPDEVQYGARKKGSWPHPDQRHLFLSPLDRTCEKRFTFNLRGKVSAIEEDEASLATISQLNLNDVELIQMRKEAINGVLGIEHNLRLSDARKRLKSLEQATGDVLEPFCFVLLQALRKHIRRLEHIRSSRTKR